MFDDSDFNDFDDEEFDGEEWSEQEWEEFFQEEDDQKRRLQELLDKYGFTEEGLRKAFEEMGYYIPEDDDDLTDIDSLDELDDDIDDIIEHEYGDEWEPEISDQSHLQNAHPLFRSCYYLVLKIMKSLRHLRVKHRDHPIIIFQTGLFECMSKLIRAGYDDIDSKLEAEQGLILAALKRARKALFLSLLTIPRLDALKIFSGTTLILYRNEITELLKQINQEIILNKTEK
jgi:hypothetical protein